MVPTKYPRFLLNQPLDAKDAFFTKNLPSDKRIGPHRFEVLCFIYASLMGDAHGEKRRKGVRFTFHQSTRNLEYLYYLRDFL
jgi:hypothetical protein